MVIGPYIQGLGQGLSQYVCFRAGQSLGQGSDQRTDGPISRNYSDSLRVGLGVDQGFVLGLDQRTGGPKAVAIQIDDMHPGLRPGREPGGVLPLGCLLCWSLWF